MADKNRKHRLRPFMVSNESIQNRKPHEPSAAIHIEDSNGGFLTARLTTGLRNQIPEPAIGLLIWNTDTAMFEYYDGSAWIPFGGSSIPTAPTIPDPMITVDTGKSTGSRNVRLYLSQSANHLASLNPRFILMRYKSGRKSPSVAGGGRYFHKRWVHPSHRNGINGVGNINTGQHYANNGALIPPRDSEWTPAALGPFQDTSISIDFKVWFGTRQTNSGVGAYRIPTGSSNSSGYGVRSQTQHFAFVLEIDNPDAATATTKRRVRGPMSPVLTVRWHSVNNEMDLTIGGGIPNARNYVP